MSTDAAADPVVESGERPPDTPGQVDRIDAAAKVEGRLPGVHHVETLFGGEVAGS